MTSAPSRPDVVADIGAVRPRTGRRPTRLALGNWPVRWKVLAIVVVPMLLALAFGGQRIHSGWTRAAESARAADLAATAPAIVDYLSALEGALLTNSTGGDAQAALTTFDGAKRDLAERLNAGDPPQDVRAGITSLLDGGQTLLDQVTANGIDLRGRIAAYAPILLTAEDVVTESVRVDDERVRTQTLGLSRALGARGQMTMQQLLVNLGGEMPEPELRTSMITIAGTEPSTLTGMAQLLGVGSPDARTLQSQLVTRMTLLSDPAVPLVGNADLTASIATTARIANAVIASTAPSITATVRDQADAQRSAAIRDSIVAAVTLLIALAVVWVVARSLVRPLRRLRDGAIKVAHEDLARELEQVRAGVPPAPVRPLPVNTTEEVGQVAHAVDELHEQAVLLASEQARLQHQVSDMFETLSRRSRLLVDQQLTLIDRLEADEHDPDRLGRLFELDNLAARMRRNGANLLVLAGSRVPRDRADAVPLVTVINAAASEVQDYPRVITGHVADGAVRGSVAGDLVHLLAELLDNALRNSPPVAEVVASAVYGDDGGLLIEVADAGLGMAESDLRMTNARLRSGGEVDPYTARHMGLFVAGRLAAQHGLDVWLRPTVAGQPNSGLTAAVHLSAGLLAPVGHSRSEPAEPSRGVAAEPPPLAFAEPGPPAPAAPRAVAPADVTVSLLPQRNPGASGISGIPTPPPAPRAQPAAAAPPVAPLARPAPTPARPARPAEPARPMAVPPPAPEPVRAATPAPAQDPEPREPESSRPPRPTLGEPGLPGPAPTTPSLGESAVDSGGSIFDAMLSEWLIDDPSQLAVSADLDWKTVWDQGWEAAAAADHAPVAGHTEHGLPVRRPGARLVPGAPEDASGNGHHANGNHANGSHANGNHANGSHANGSHANGYGDGDGDGDPSGAGAEAPAPIRDPEAVRSSIAGHFGGVHAGRRHARGGDEEPPRR